MTLCDKIAKRRVDNDIKWQANEEAKKIHPTKNATYSQKPEIAKSLSVLYVVLNGCPYTTQHTQRKYQKIFMAVERGGGRKNGNEIFL